MFFPANLLVSTEKTKIKNQKNNYKNINKSRLTKLK